MSTYPVINPPEQCIEDGSEDWEDDFDPYDDEEYFDEDEEWCSSPGRSGPGLCSDDLYRGAGVCMYEGVER